MRLVHPTIIPNARRITFGFDGQPIEALEGETVGAALSAAGIVTLRHTRSGAPRGIHCGMGACFDCVVTVDGRIGQRACMTPAADGMQVASTMPATLDARDPAPEQEERACDVLIVGAGVAGLSAAIAAAQSGARTVLLDERSAPGGQYAKPLAPSHQDSAPDRQFAVGNALRASAEKEGVVVETGALVWGAFAADEIAAMVRGQSILYRPRRLILATGAHEAPMPIPGWTLPGVMTTGGLQALVRAQRVAPGSRILIAGNGPLNLQLAAELVACGVKPVAVLEAARYPGLLAGLDALKMGWFGPDLTEDGKRLIKGLRRARVPVRWRTVPDRLEGDGRVQVVIAGKRRWDVDVVALNWGFQPEVGLARALGVPHRISQRGALETDAAADGRTAVPDVFAVGDGAVFGGARVAQSAGRMAGLAAARDLGFPAQTDRRSPVAVRRAERFQEALWHLFRAKPLPIVDETIVCRCEEVTAGRLRAEIAGGLVSLAALKKATRAGMGPCQGRFCAATIMRLCPSRGGAEDFAAPQAPLRPVPAAPLMRQAPEFVAPLLDNPRPPARLHALAPVPAEARNADVVVIGGGVVGLSTAYFLAKGGADVLVIDRDEAAMAASTATGATQHCAVEGYRHGGGGGSGHPHRGRPDSGRG
jgi:thioredoxin reductase